MREASSIGLVDVGALPLKVAPDAHETIDDRSIEDGERR